MTDEHKAELPKYLRCTEKKLLQKKQQNQLQQKPAGEAMNGDNLIPLHCILCGYATAMRNSSIIWMLYLSNTP